MFAQSTLIPKARALAKKVRWYPEFVRFKADLGAGFSLGFERDLDTDGDEDTDILPEGQRPPKFPPVILSHPGQTSVEMTNSIQLNVSLTVWYSHLYLDGHKIEDSIEEWHRDFQSLVAEHIPEHIVSEQPHLFTFKASPTVASPNSHRVACCCLIAPQADILCSSRHARW